MHNSGWVQGPGADALNDPAQYPRLQIYVQGIVGAFAMESRVLAWDLWNEPNNTNHTAYGKEELQNKVELVEALLPKVFEWARSVKPIQPLTSGVWEGDWSSRERLSPIQRIQLEQSDVVSFHNYGWPEDFERAVIWLEPYHRPILCTEFMARPQGSTFDTILPLAKKHRVAAINWGLVAGKTQTYLPWDSWQRPYVLEGPAVWFHEVFHSDGKPYRDREAQIFRELTTMPEKPNKCSCVNHNHKSGVSSQPLHPINQSQQPDDHLGRSTEDARSCVRPPSWTNLLSAKCISLTLRASHG